jgi:hypothetical protein
MPHRITERDDTQNGRILLNLKGYLHSTCEGWVPMPTLAKSGSGSDDGFCMVHSRIADLRADGYVIEQRSEREGRKTKSFYRLVEQEEVPA